MHLPVIAAGHNLAAKHPLCRVHGVHQVGKTAWGSCIGARDVRRIASILGAGIEQERAQGGGSGTLQVLVMQHRGVLVVRHDVVVRHLLFALGASLKIAHVRFVFGFPTTERGQRSLVSARAQRAGAAHAFELVRRLYGPIVVQARQKVRRIDARRVGLGTEPIGADVGHPAEVRPVTACLRWLVHSDQIDLGRPRRPRQPGRFVPIIVWLMEQNFEPRTGRDDQNTAWIILDGNPGLEMGVDLVRVVLIVQELDGRGARVDDQRIEAARRERPLRAPHERLQMRLIQLIDTGFAHFSSRPR